MSNNKKMTVALVYGGQSGEHEVSLLSAASVLTALDSQRFDIVPFAIDKNGQWYQHAFAPLKAQALESLPVHGKNAVAVNFSSSLFAAIDVVLPILHGPLYEDGCLQGFFELIGIPYVGSGVLGSAVAMDKDVAKRLVKAEGIAVAPGVVLHSSQSSEQIKAACQQAIIEFDLPLFVKPACQGSSVGIHKVESADKLETAVNDAFGYDDKVLIESFIDGQEVELAVLGTRQAPKVSVSGEITMQTNDAFYSYQAKYQDASAAKLSVPANISEEQQTQLINLSTKIFRSLCCFGLARVDFFIERDTGMIFFNELNTLPGFTKISMYPRLWQASGLELKALITELIDLAFARAARRELRLSAFTEKKTLINQNVVNLSSLV